MLTRRTQIDRVLAGAIVVPTIVCLFATIYLAWGASNVEFQWSRTAYFRNNELQADGFDYTPQFTAIYRKHYQWSWLLVPVAMVWGVWLLRKRACSLLAVVLYVGVLLTATVVWLLLTLLAFYCHNQTFRW